MSQIDTTRLIKLLGMLGSDFDGERAAAGLAAHRLLQQHRLTWTDVLQPALPPPSRHRRVREVSTNDEAIAFCADFAHALTTWERDFVASLAADRYRRLSQKQMVVLARLVEKCRRAERAAA